MSSRTASTRIDLRIDADKKSIVCRAAELLGVNLTQFIIDRVLPEAERIVQEDHRIRLSKADWERFTAKLDEPPKDLPELRKLLLERSIFVRTKE